MESYSHGPFEVSGYRITIENPEQERERIMSAWKLWFTENMETLVIEKEYPTLHAVYYNYHDQLDRTRKWYDMLIGYITKTGTTQSSPQITTIQIPAQDYRYTTLDDISPESIFGTWNTINNTPASELARNYGYDLDMYNETHTGMTIAVSVSE